MTTKKAKKMTFRQRLRIAAGDKLDGLLEQIVERVDELVVIHTEINKYDLMRLACGGRTAALRNRLITELADEAEAKMEEIYNRQISLRLEKPDDFPDDFEKPDGK